MGRKNRTKTKNKNTKTEPVKNTEIEDNQDNHDERILNILGVQDYDDIDVAMELIQKFLDYCRENITFPCIVTGIEDSGCFGWEEYYAFGPGSKKEHEKLKKGTCLIYG